MMSVDKDALLCDLAETYGVFDFRALPLMTIATLASGLRDSSRIKHKMNSLTEVPAEYTLVHIADAMSVLLSGLAGDGKETPPLYADVMAGKHKNNGKKEKQGFDSIEAFEAARKRFIDG